MTADDPIRAAREELAAPSVSRSLEAVGGEAAGDRIGHYKLLQIIGEGGMGTVWMAEQSEPVRRKVALKIIKLGMDTKEVVTRFEAERQALAVMEHPHIARVFDGGATASGRPFFVMELVRGVPITQHCEQAGLGLRDRLELFGKVCGAIHHAHQKGVIHRDVKPSNVLVTLHDGVPVPKVIDFGIAKATSAELTQKTLFTQYAQMIGTPEYMAPEQAEMSGLDIDTRADVYSLGVLLYELLTGSKPFDAADALSRGYSELLKTIREIDPARPSHRVSTARGAASPVGGLRSVDPSELSRQLQGDLDCIVMKALEKDRYRRYDSASAFADDIARHLRDEPVRAAPASRVYVLRKAVQRNRTAVAVGAGILVLLVAGITGTAWGLLRAVDALEAAEGARRDAERAQLEAETVADFTSGMLRGVSPRNARGRDTTLLRELTDEAARKLAARDLRDAPGAELRLRTTIGSVYQSLGALAEASELLEAALRQAAELHPEPHLETAGLWATLGRIDMELARRVEARERYAEARAILERLEGDEARLGLAQIDNDLSMLARDDGDLATAERLIRRAVATKRELQHLGPTMLGASLGTLGSALSAGGDLEGAADAFQEALDLARDGADGPSVEQLVALSNLAFVELKRGRPLVAEPLCRESVAMARACYPGDHQFVAAALEGLSDALNDQGRFRELLPFVQEAHAMLARIYPELHPRRIDAADKLARVLREVGRLDEAFRLSAAAMQGLDGLPAEEVLRKARILQTHGRLLLDLGRRTEASEALRRALALARSSIDPPEGELAGLLLDVANALDPVEARSEVELLLREALERARRAAPAAGSLLQANALDNLGSHLGGAAGDELLRAALAMKREVAPADHPDTATTAIKLAERLLDAGEPRAAQPLAEEALAISQARWGGDHPRCLRATLTLAVIVGSTGEAARAEGMLVEVLEAARQLPMHQGGVLIAQACARLLQPALARADLATAAELAAEALAAWAVVEVPPGIATATAHVNAGFVAMQRGETSPARRHFRTAADLFEQQPERADQSALLNLLQLAILEAGDGDRDAAVQALERLLRLAERVPGIHHGVQFRAANELLSMARERGDLRAVLRAAELATRWGDLALPDQPQLGHSLRIEQLRASIALLDDTPDRAARRLLLERAERVARENLALCEQHFAADPGLAWLVEDASSRCGEVLFLDARERASTDPELARARLAEARLRTVEAATEFWSDVWSSDRRPPTAKVAAARVVAILEYLAELEPAGGHAEQLDAWRERAGLRDGR